MFDEANDGYLVAHFLVCWRGHSSLRWWSRLEFFVVTRRLPLLSSRFVFSPHIASGINNRERRQERLNAITEYSNRCMNSKCTYLDIRFDVP